MYICIYLYSLSNLGRSGGPEGIKAWALTVAVGALCREKLLWHQKRGDATRHFKISMENAKDLQKM